MFSFQVLTDDGGTQQTGSGPDLLRGIAGSRGFVLVLRDLRQQDRLRLAAGTEDASLRQD